MKYVIVKPKMADFDHYRYLNKTSGFEMFLTHFGATQTVLNVYIKPGHFLQKLVPPV